MSEIEESVSLQKHHWRWRVIGFYIRRAAVRDLRRVIGAVVLAAMAVLAVEAISSYVLFRHFARLDRSFYPVGSATIALARNVVAKAKGRHSDEVLVTIDHGPLFRADGTLGYSMYPGKYRITERRFGHSHAFDLTVDEFGRRVTAERANASPRRLYMAGDSGMFGWGLNDEQTAPWLLQARFPKLNVVNLSLTSYSMVQALLELEHTSPKVTADDIVVLTYHPITNGFNVASNEMLGFLRTGFEHQLGDSALVHDMVIPFGSIDGGGRLSVEHYAVVACAKGGAAGAQCPPRQLSTDEANRVTERAFDAILAAQPGQVVIALLSGGDSDPVVEHFRSKGVFIADLRMDTGDPDATDLVLIDDHAGPFWHRALAQRLGDALRQARLVE
ncbi:MAG: hypothetical protein ABSH33_14650 [Steroidobacteraceae bacterium]|jgi:hypothetical protein